MRRLIGGIGVVTLLFGSVTGCGQQAVQATSSGAQTQSIDQANYVLAEEPDGAVGVMIAREDAKDQDDIVLVGRIGGRKNPWIEGRSAFTLIDASMTVVADGTESDGGQLCMDDCCASLRADCTTLVKVVDDHGQVLPIDARCCWAPAKMTWSLSKARCSAMTKGVFPSPPVACM